MFINLLSELKNTFLVVILDLEYNKTLKIFQYQDLYIISLFTQSLLNSITSEVENKFF